jgi:hypothetical protein
MEILGVEGASNLTTTEKLGRVLIVPGDVDIADVMQLWDRLASAKLGKPVFFGLRSLYKQHCDGRQPAKEDYVMQIERSRRQRAQLKTTAKKVADETIARRGQAHNNLQAVHLLAEVAKNHITEYVVEQPSVDARLIVGREATAWVAQAQFMHAIGDIHGSRLALVRAKASARPTGCPTGSSKKRNGSDSLNPDEDLLGLENDEDETVEEDQFGSLAFNCPSCKRENKRKPGSKDDFIEECKHCHKAIPRCGPKKVDNDGQKAGNILEQLAVRKSKLALAA